MQNKTQIKMLKHLITLIKIRSLLFVLPILSFAQSEQATRAFNQLAKKESNREWIEMKSMERIDASSFIEKAKFIWDLPDSDELTIKKTETDDLGWTHYRLQQKHNGIPVEFSQYILHEKEGLIEKANGHLVGNLTITTTPSLSGIEATQILLDHTNATKYAWEDETMEKMLKSIQKDSLATYCPKEELVIVSSTFDNNPENYRLAYKIDIFSLEPYNRNYFYVDAHTGEIINKLTRIHENDATGVANTNYYGTVNIKTTAHNNTYRLRETGRGNGIETFTSNNTYAHPTIDITDIDNYWYTNSDITGCEAHWGSEKVYDYFLDKHNRDSYDNQGAKIQSWVNYGVNYVNAFWNGSYMTYGDGNDSSYGALTCLDVVGHEITHAITERTAGLIYSYESGALNESFSDIFGALVEFEHDPNGGDWYMGEDANLSGNGFRNLSNPNAKQHPDTYNGTYWYAGSGDNGGVHYNSGVQNFWFYLLAQGGSGTNDNGDNYNVSAIGKTKAAKIAFRNLTVYLTPTSNYAAARNGAIQAATDLYGANSNEVQQVTNAWCAVGVGTCYSAPNGQLTLTSPNGGETLTQSTTHYITWNSTGTVGNVVKLQYSINGGATWTTITSGTSNDGSRSWSVPNVTTTLARVRVTSTSNNAITDKSNTNFKIEAPTPPPPNNCNANSLELGQDVYLPNGGSVTLSTGLQNMAYTLWDYNGSLISNNSSVSVNNTGTYYAAVADSCGNTANDSIQVLPETSTLTNVWPGDMNFDGVVDFRDFDPYGLHFGQTGALRTNQGNTWYPHPSSDWNGTQINGANVKHVDANGSGIIDLSDGHAVNYNYGKTHNDSPIQATPVLMGQSPIEITLQPTVVPTFNGNNQLSFDIVLNNVTGNDLAFYGGYFTIDYADPNSVASNPQIDLSNTWLGTLNENLLYISNIDSSNQQIQIGITRIDHANVIGSGSIGKITFDIANTAFSDNATLDFEVSNIDFHNSEATDLSIATDAVTLNFNTDICPDDLTIDYSTYLPGIHQVSENILTNGPVNIQNGQSVFFKGDQITLNEAFSIQTGANFSATIDPCDANSLISNKDKNKLQLHLLPNIIEIKSEGYRHYYILGN